MANGKPFWVLFLLCSVFSASAQHTFLTLHEDQYHLLDRYSIIADSASPFCTSIKPFNRAYIPELAETTVMGYDRISAVDLFNLDQIAWGSWEAYDSALKSAFKRKQRKLFKYPGSAIIAEQPDFICIVNPAMAFMYGKEDDVNLYRNTRGIELRGIVGQKVGFYSFVSENQHVFPTHVLDYATQTEVLPGSGLIKPLGKTGYDYMNARGYISFNPLDQITLQFGHDKNFIGNGYRSLIQSDFAKENLFLKLHTQVGRINYLNLFQELTDYNNRTTSGLRKKYSALHYLNFAIKPGTFDIGLFENVVFSRQDSSQQPGFDLNYLNPIIFYRVVEHMLNSSDNAILGADIKWNSSNQVQLYGQYVLDELKVSELFGRTQSWLNKWAAQLGVKYLNVAGINNLDLQMEYNAIRPFVYSHFKKNQSWSHHNQSMAHPNGANLTEWVSIMRYQPIRKLELVVKNIVRTQGLDTAGFSFGGDISIPYTNRPFDGPYEIGEGLKTVVQYTEFQASYQLFQRAFADVRLIHRKITQEDVSTGSTFFTLGLRMNMSPTRYDY